MDNEKISTGFLINDAKMDLNDDIISYKRVEYPYKARYPKKCDLKMFWLEKIWVIVCDFSKKRQRSKALGAVS